MEVNRPEPADHEHQHSFPGTSYLVAAKAFEAAPVYAALRSARCPVHIETEHEAPFAVLSRFDDVLSALRDPTQWRNGDGPGIFFQSGVLGSADDPDHHRQRGVLRASFSPPAIARHEPFVRATCDRLLDQMLPLGSADFVPAFALAFPALVIAELLGVAPEDHPMFQHLAETIVSALSGGDVEAYQDARSQLGDYIEARLDERASGAVQPRADIVQALWAGIDTGAISMEEARLLGHQLLVAGHETTASLLSLMLYRLIQHPEALVALRADSNRIPDAIEEALRFDAPVSGLFRTNSSACTLHGADLPERTKTQLLFAAANRDPERFAEPDAFRVDRSRDELGHHLGFGWGTHYCIGAPLARLEAKVAFEALLARTATIELNGTPVRNDSYVLHGLTSLPVRWTLATSN